jgi:hypothetical protein
MSQLVPNRFLFDFEFPLRYLRRVPKLDGRLSGWTDDYLVPDWSSLDNATPFGRIWAGWHESGLFVGCRVEGKRRPLQCDPAAYWEGDNLRLCIDTRDTRTIRRASRFCRQVYLLPAGGGTGGNQPVAGAGRFNRAREHAPDAPASAFRIASRVTNTGYTMDAHVATEALPGYDAAEHPRIGFFYILEDGELGQQPLTVGDDLYWNVDPSTWPTAVLTR